MNLIDELRRQIGDHSSGAAFIHFRDYKILLKQEQARRVASRMRKSMNGRKYFADISWMRNTETGAAISIERIYTYQAWK